jgi:hypothetical protein
MTDPDLPELPSDEELGIAGMDEDDLLGEVHDPGDGGAPPASREPGSEEEGPGGPSGPARWLPALVVLLLLVVGAWASSSQRLLPPPVPANAPDSAFSSARAMSQLVDLARAPRPPGSPEHSRVRELLVERLEDLGLEPRLHTTVSLRRTGQTVRAVTLRNVVARIPGTASSGAILLTAHYDGVPLSPAAGDDGTGVATILEIVRALQSAPPLQNDVIVLLTDGEELGLLGARAFVEEHQWMDDVAVVLSVEMRGVAGPSIMFETGRDNGWIVQAMKAGDPRPLAHSLSVDVYRRMPHATDFTAFREAGIQGLNFAAIGDPWAYHQPTDRADNVDERTLQHHGIRLLGVTRELGERDLSEVHAPDRAYFVLPVLGMIDFPVGWTVPTAPALLLLWLVVVLMARTRGSRASAVVMGFLTTVVAGAAGYGVGWGLMWWLPQFHPEYGHIYPSFYGEGWYVAGLTLAVVGVTMGLFALMRGRFSLAGLAAGAILVPVLGGVVLAVLAPLSAVVLIAPAGVGLLAAGVLSVGERKRRGAPLPLATWIPCALLALPVLALMVPVLELLWVAMSFRLAPILGVGVVVTAVCALPALAVLHQPNGWWFPPAAFLLGCGLVGVGILRGGPSEDRPLPSTLIYALDREEERALWATRDDPGLDWAAETVGSFREEGSLESFFVQPLYGVNGPISASYRLATAPLFELPAPEVSVHVPTSVIAAGPLGLGPIVPLRPGTFQMVIRSELGAEVVGVRVREGEASIVEVAGRRVPPAAAGSLGARRPVTTMLHMGVPEGDLQVGLEVGDELEGAILGVELLEQHLRPTQILEADLFRRPAGLMPAPEARSDRILVRSRAELTVPGPARAPGMESWLELETELDDVEVEADTIQAEVEADTVELDLDVDTLDLDLDTLDLDVDTLNLDVDPDTLSPPSLTFDPSGPRIP